LAEQRVAGRVALVTGATSGIGRAVAEAFAAEGAVVTGIGRDRPAGAESERRIAERGGRFRFIACDVSREPEVDAVIAVVRATHGRLDIAANCAGVDHVAALIDSDAAAYDRVFDANVRGLFFCLRAELRSMRDGGGGAIVNIGSVAGQRPYRKNGLYNASKAAVAMLTRTAALECGGLSIRVNEVAPGPVATPMLEGYLAGLAADKAAAVRDELSAATPLGGISAAGDIARAVVFLCSDEAARITGATLTVDGGFVLS
jgi:NAD(P)-dependent dehydrogenase (short-subunit alcohol dehydrogenase family)